MRLATAGLCAVVLAASMGQGSQLSPTAPRRPVRGHRGGAGSFVPPLRGSRGPRAPAASRARRSPRRRGRAARARSPAAAAARRRRRAAVRVPAPVAAAAAGGRHRRPALPAPGRSRGRAAADVGRPRDRAAPLAGGRRAPGLAPERDVLAADGPGRLARGPRRRRRPRPPRRRSPRGSGAGWGRARCCSSRGSASRWRPNTAVEVPAGTRPATGAPPAAVQWTFTTPPPTLAVKHPADVTARPETLIFAAFDQAIDPAAMVRFVRVTAGQGLREVRLATAEEVEADADVKRLAEKAGQGRWLAFRAVAAAAAGHGRDGGDRPGRAVRRGPAGDDRRAELGVPHLRPAAGRPPPVRLGHSECPPGAPWQIELSNALDAAAFKKEMVRVAPELPGLQVSVHGDDPRHPRAVAAAHDVRGHAGRRAARRLRPDPRAGPDGALHRRAARSRRSPPPASRMVVLDPAGGPAFVGLFGGRRRAAGHRPPGRARGLAGVPHVPERCAARPDAARDPGHARLRAPRARRGVRSTSSWRRPSTSAPRSPAGWATPSSSPLPRTSPTGSERWPGRVIRWVQSTRIGLDAFVDERRLLAWATSLGRRPPAGRRRGRAARPRAPRRGRAPTAWRRSSSGRPPPRLVARAGNDVALLPASPAWWDAARVDAGERRRPAALDGLRRPRPVSPGRRGAGQGLGPARGPRPRRRRRARAGVGAVGGRTCCATRRATRSRRAARR